jgi:arginyl-tRNA synthetase
MDLAVSTSNDNPVYYVQYAHARICSIFRQAEEQGIAVDHGKADLTRLTAEAEFELLRKLGELPQEVAEAAEARAPHRIIRYVYELASMFHSYYKANRVITDDAAQTAARLALMAAIRVVIANVLRLIGVSAPERM